MKLITLSILASLMISTPAIALTHDPIGDIISASHHAVKPAEVPQIQQVDVTPSDILPIVYAAMATAHDVRMEMRKTHHQRISRLALD